MAFFPDQHARMSLEQMLNPKTEFPQSDCDTFQTLNTLVERIRYAEILIRTKGFDPSDAPEGFQRPKDNFIATRHRDQAKAFLEKNKYREAFASANTAICYASGNEALSESYATRADIFYQLGNYELAMESLRLCIAEGGCSKKTEHRVNVMWAVCDRRIEEESCKPKKPPRPTHIPHVPRVSGNMHPDLPFLDQRLYLDYSQDTGRTIRTNKPISAGKIVGFDQAICPTLNIEARRLRCASCLQENFFSLVPCETCVCTMFCSNESCKDYGMKLFHRYECPIIDFLYNNPDYRSLVRMLLVTFKNPGDIEDFQNFTQSFDYGLMNACTMNWQVLPPNYQAKLAFTLPINEARRSENELFYLCRMAAYIFVVILNKTKIVSELFPTEVKRDFLREYCYRHLLVITSNMHSLSNTSLFRFNEEPQESRPFALALLPFVNLIRHSCKANVHLAGYGINKVALYAVRPIAAGEELKFDYVYGLSPTWRLEMLNTKYNHICRCYDDTKELGYVNPESRVAGLNHVLPLASVGTLFMDDNSVVLRKLEQAAEFLTDHDDSYPSQELFVNRRIVDLCFERLLGNPIVFDYGHEPFAVFIKKQEEAIVNELHTKWLEEEQVLSKKEREKEYRKAIRKWVDPRQAAALKKIADRNKPKNKPEKESKLEPETAPKKKKKKTKKRKKAALANDETGGVKVLDEASNLVEPMDALKIADMTGKSTGVDKTKNSDQKDEQLIDEKLNKTALIIDNDSVFKKPEAPGPLNIRLKKSNEKKTSFSDTDKSEQNQEESKLVSSEQKTTDAGPSQNPSKKSKKKKSKSSNTTVDSEQRQVETTVVVPDSKPQNDADVGACAPNPQEPKAVKVHTSAETILPEQSTDTVSSKKPKKNKKKKPANNLNNL